jgi:hypothetical protein
MAKINVYTVEKSSELQRSSHTNDDEEMSAPDIGDREAFVWCPSALFGGLPVLCPAANRLYPSPFS